MKSPQANLSAFAVGSRSRKGAWIEILILVCVLVPVMVAPVRERGLKYIRAIVS